eukprot:TRINITY_DN7412_c0_g1_i1.p1 TRINITY_DN7412_c0_g1~~TRINITY_DN7412_c0_g1_i1.p1  ORF type:complete len:741 (-),score=141.33 TRINITY_DN7412_c0_g1_i1:30-2252(-)
MFATQFEAISARTAYPCWDEPAYKSHFEFSVSVPNTRDWIILANTEEKSRTIKSGKILATFARTNIKMSSYLVAFAVGEFDYVEATDSGVRFRIFTPPGQAKYAEFALDVTTKIVKHFGDRLGIPYSWINPKMDQISVPGIFENAMENQGLLTYYPPFLLADPTNATHVAYELVAEVTTHEISHQWYGDTITCPYWTSEYLQEGFARLFQYMATQYLFPEWEVFYEPAETASFGDISFYGWPYEHGMTADYQGMSPPVIVLDQHKKESSVMLYEKGASVNRMILLHFGEEKWFAGLGYHVQKWRERNPDVFDLMADFALVVDSDIEDKWLPWLLQRGFPVVEISLNENDGKITLRQEPISRYLPASEWWIPLQVYAEEEGHDGDGIVIDLELTGERQEYYLPFEHHFHLVTGNFNYTTFACVSYGKELNEMWRRNIRHAAAATAQTLDINLFVYQLAILTQMSHVKIEVALEMWRHLEREHFPSAKPDAVFSITSKFLQRSYTQVFKSFIVDDTDRVWRDVRREMAGGLKPLVEKYGWAGDASLAKLRDVVTFWAVFYGEEESVAKATAVWNALSFNTGADIQRAVFVEAARGNFTSVYLLVMNHKLLDKSTEDNLVNALQIGSPRGKCKDALKAILQKRLNKDRYDELKKVSGMMIWNGECREEAWRAYRDLADAAWKADGAAATGNVLAGMSGVFGTAARRNELRDFLKEHEQFVDSATRNSQVLLIDQNIDLVKMQS